MGERTDGLDHMLRIADVVRVTGTSKASIYRWLRSEEDPFPPPVKLGPNSVGWWASEIQAWLESRERVDPTAPADAETG